MHSRRCNRIWRHTNPADTQVAQSWNRPRWTCFPTARDSPWWCWNSSGLWWTSLAAGPVCLSGQLLTVDNSPLERAHRTVTQTKNKTRFRVKMDHLQVHGLPLSLFDWVEVWHSRSRRRSKCTHSHSESAASDGSEQYRRERLKLMLLNTSNTAQIFKS